MNIEKKIRDLEIQLDIQKEINEVFKNRLDKLEFFNKILVKEILKKK